MDAVSQRYPITGPDGYTMQIDLLLAAGQYLLRHFIPEEEFRGALEIHRLVEIIPDQVARYEGVSCLAVHMTFSPP